MHQHQPKLLIATITGKRHSIQGKPWGCIHIDTSTNSESGFRFTARTSFTGGREHSWSLVQGQLNACLPTISS